METCSNDHEEIVHCERYCPLCVSNSTIRDLELEIEKLRDEIKNMEVIDDKVA